MSVIDGETMALTGRVEVGPQPLTIRTSPDGLTAWVASLGRGMVTVVDLEAMAPVAELAGHPVSGEGSAHGLCYITPA
jgi:DNA-binding beta-propeller fold protein YncE